MGDFQGILWIALEKSVYRNICEELILCVQSSPTKPAVLTRKEKLVKAS